MTTSDPRDPNQVPDGMKDEVKTDNPAPSDFNDDGEVEEDFEGDDDEESDDD